MQLVCNLEDWGWKVRNDRKPSATKAGDKGDAAGRASEGSGSSSRTASSASAKARRARSRPRESAAPSATSSAPTAEDGARFVVTTPQIEVALAEIRFARPVKEVTARQRYDEIRDALRAAGIDLQSVQPAAAHEVSLALTPAGVQSSSVAQDNGRKSDAERKLIITVLPASASIQTTRYERWGVSLRPVLEALLAALDQALAPQLRSRVGLRYVNRFADPAASSAAHWPEDLRPPTGAAQRPRHRQTGPRRAATARVIRRSFTRQNPEARLFPRLSRARHV